VVPKSSGTPATTIAVLLEQVVTWQASHVVRVESLGQCRFESASGKQTLLTLERKFCAR